jgi:hypothetical protein
MKLSEALILRAENQRKIEQLRQRLIKVAKVQEEETPAEDPQTLLTELDTAIAELENLVKQINRTNSQTIFEENITISDALAKRDALKLKSSVYHSLIAEASDSYSRYSRSEIKYLSTVNVAEIQSQIDQMSKQYRELDTKIQASNWNTDLITDSEN